MQTSLKTVIPLHSKAAGRAATMAFLFGIGETSPSNLLPPVILTVSLIDLIISPKTRFLDSNTRQPIQYRIALCLKINPQDTTHQDL